MKNKKPNAELVWKQLEDLLVPRLNLSVIERTVYSHLLRHSRLEGKLRLRFSIRWLAHNIRLSAGPVRGGGIKPILAEEISENPCCSGNREGLSVFAPIRMIAGIRKKQR